jgi:hypothetical protein
MTDCINKRRLSMRSPSITAKTISTIDEQARTRWLALADAVDQARRSAAALLAASCDEQDMARVAVLVRARRDVLNVLIALTGLG